MNHSILDKPHYVVLKNPPTRFKCPCRNKSIDVKYIDQHLKTQGHLKYKERLNNFNKRLIADSK